MVSGELPIAKKGKKWRRKGKEQAFGMEPIGNV
jgi:hypothetical protein